MGGRPTSKVSIMFILDIRGWGGIYLKSLSCYHVIMFNFGMWGGGVEAVLHLTSLPCLYFTVQWAGGRGAMMV